MQNIPMPKFYEDVFGHSSRSPLPALASRPTSSSFMAAPDRRLFQSELRLTGLSFPTGSDAGGQSFGPVLPIDPVNREIGRA